MLTQAFKELELSTEERGLYEITGDVQRAVREAGMKSGLATIQVLHTSASLLIQENADPDVRADFERFFSRLVADGDALFEHTCEGPDDMPAHVRSALTAVSLGVAFQDSRLCLGTWQGIYLWEHRRSPHRRIISIHLLGE